MRPSIDANVCALNKVTHHFFCRGPAAKCDAKVRQHCLLCAGRSLKKSSIQALAPLDVGDIEPRPISAADIAEGFGNVEGPQELNDPFGRVHFGDEDGNAAAGVGAAPPLAPLPEAGPPHAGQGAAPALLEPPVRPGRWQRTLAGIRYINQCRKVKMLGVARERDRIGFRNLATAWNQRLGLRRGDRVTLDGAVRTCGAKTTRVRKRRAVGDNLAQNSSHPNSWTLEGMLTVGFQGIGQAVAASRSRARFRRQPRDGADAGTARPKAARESSTVQVGEAASGRMLSATSAVASLFGTAQADAIAKCLASLRERRGSMFVGVCYDATPLHITFGALAEHLQGSARYLVLDRESGKWTAVPLAKYMGVRKRSIPQTGISELFAQSTTLSWFDGDQFISRTVLVPPRFIQDGRASTVYRAVNDGVKSLCVDTALPLLCEEMRWIMICETPDNAGANQRKMWATAERLPRNCLFIGSGCCVHHCHRIVASVTQAPGHLSLMGDIFATKFVTHISSNYCHLSRALKELLQEELLVLHSSQVSAAERAEWEQHTMQIVEHTIHRRARYTRGRLKHTGEEVSRGRREKRDEEAALRLRSICNGDARLQRCVHICNGCCEDRDHAVENFYLALLDNYILLGQSGLPAESRWGTITQCNAQLSAGLLMHGVFARAWRRAFPKWDIVGDNLQQENGPMDEDFVLSMKRKTFRVGKFLADRSDRALLTAFVTEALDWLWHRVQHLDEDPGSWSLSIGTDPSTSPFHVCVRRLTSLLTAPLPETTMSALWRHHRFHKSAADLSRFVEEARIVIVGMIAQVVWRFVVPFSTWPYKLARMVRPGVSARERLSLAAELLSARPCCVDMYCSQKLRDAYASPEALVEDRELQAVLEAWCRTGRLCNMHTERQFARIRKAVPSGKPYAERVCAAGMLTQVRHAHVQAGGVCPSAFNRQDLRDLEAPVASRIERPESCPKRARGHVLFMTKRLREETAMLPAGARLSRAQQAAIRRDACREYRLLGADEQERLTEEAVLEARCPAGAKVPRVAEYDTDALWGVSEKRSPLAFSTAAEHIEAALGVSDVEVGCARTRTSLLWAGAWREMVWVRQTHEQS